MDPAKEVFGVILDKKVKEEAIKKLDSINLKVRKLDEMLKSKVVSKGNGNSIEVVQNAGASTETKEDDVYVPKWRT